jgi:hypothetical protein
MKVNPFLNFKILNMFENFTGAILTDIDRVPESKFNMLDIMHMPEDKVDKNIFKLIE